MIFLDLFDRLSYAVDLCILPWNCVSGNLLVFLGSFSGDVQCSEHYSTSDRRKLEMCAKFISIRPLTWKIRRAAEGLKGGGGGSSHPLTHEPSPIRVMCQSIPSLNTLRATAGDSHIPIPTAQGGVFVKLCQGIGVLN